VTAQSYIAPKAVAERLAVSVKLIYKLVAAGELKAVKIGRCVRVLMDSLQDFLDRHATGRCQTPPLSPAPAVPAPTPPRRRPGPSGFVFLPPKQP
jgi:excisionase family DNA binding protein